MCKCMWLSNGEKLQFILTNRWRKRTCDINLKRPNPFIFMIDDHKLFFFLKGYTCILTCILLLPQSATMIFPFASTATPVGALNWPLPSPWEPNLNKNSPSAL